MKEYTKHTSVPVPNLQHVCPKLMNPSPVMVISVSPRVSAMSGTSFFRAKEFNLTTFVESPTEARQLISLEVLKGVACEEKKEMAVSP